MASPVLVEPTSLRICLGAPVFAADGPCGVVAGIVVERGRRRVTDLVVLPRRAAPRPRLVPLAAVVSATDRVSLSWTTCTVLCAPEVAQTDVLEPGGWPTVPAGWDVGRLSHDGWLEDIAGPPSWSDAAETVVDLVPAGTVELHHDTEVVADDGRRVGRFAGLVLDAGRDVSSVVVDRGRWRGGVVTLPAASLAAVDTDALLLTAHAG